MVQVSRVDNPFLLSRSSSRHLRRCSRPRLVPLAVALQSDSKGEITDVVLVQESIKCLWERVVVSLEVVVVL